MKWRLVLVLFLGIAGVLAGGIAAGQDFPNRPITMVYPFGGGTSSDILARAISVEAAKLIGQPVVYENRPGANARLGIAALKSAKPDGYFVTVAQDAHLVAHPLVNPEFKLDVGKDYIPIAVMFEQPLVLAGSPTLPFRDFKGLVAHAKANPGKLNFTVIPGSMAHIAAVQMLYAADIKVTIVPYKQAPQQLIDIAESRGDLLVTSTTVKPQIDSGRMTGIAAIGKDRLPTLPNLPTLTESGLPIVLSGWYVLIAPPGTPPDAVGKLARAFNDARRQPNVQKMYTDYDFTPMPYLTPEEIAERVRAQIRTSEPALRKAGIKFE